MQKPAAIENHALPPRKVQAADSLRDSNDLDANPLVVDPTLAHREYLEGKLPDEFPHFTGGDACGIKNTGDGLLLSRIEVNHNFDSNTETHGVKIFCGIYTMEKNHATNVMATKNTWAKKCDGFIAFSTKTDETIPAMEIHHEGEESYDNMWQKSRSIWKAVHRHLHDQFDFFVLGGDDMFYIVENLRAYLNSDEIHAARESSKGLFIGRIFQPPNQVIFNSGGAGYIVDQKALNVLGQNLDLPHCWPHQHGFWEDVNVASCLKTSPENIVPYQTRDTNGRERFHPFNPGNHLQYRIPKNPDWYAKYNPDLKIGYECCSSESISFHYLPEKSLYKMHNFLYHCSNK